MASLLDIPLQFKAQALPALVPLRSVRNRTALCVRLEARFENWKIWIALIPRVEGGTSARVDEDALWVPRKTDLRAVELKDGRVLGVQKAFSGGVFDLDVCDQTVEEANLD